MTHIQYSILAWLFSATMCYAANQNITLDLPVNCSKHTQCTIQNYVDQDATDDHQDYTCRKLSYDKHKGTDFRIPVFSADINVEVLAAADGVVQGTRNNEPDRDLRDGTPLNVAGKECGNGLVIAHAGGWETQYCHMKEGSLAVSSGQHVTRGDILGYIGMSGHTEFPHLHLSVRNPEGAPIDPYNARPMESGCSAPVTQLWSQSAQQRLPSASEGIINVGIADQPVTAASVIHGNHQATTLPQDAPAFTAWALLYGLDAGDELTMKLYAPDGSIMTQHTNAITKFQAQYVQYIGKRRRDKLWPIGTYKLLTIVNRGTTPLIQQVNTYSVQ